MPLHPRNNSIGCLLLLAGMSGLGSAAPIIDQQNPPAPRTCFGLVFGHEPPSSAGATLGQSFIPTASLLNFVQLYFDDAFFGQDDRGYEVIVRIRGRTITGPILGTSAVVSSGEGREPNVGAVLHTFYFPRPVTLVPGSRYSSPSPFMRVPGYSVSGAPVKMIAILAAVLCEALGSRT